MRRRRLRAPLGHSRTHLAQPRDEKPNLEPKPTAGSSGLQSAQHKVVLGRRWLSEGTDWVWGLQEVRKGRPPPSPARHTPARPSQGGQLRARPTPLTKAGACGTSKLRAQGSDTVTFSLGDPKSRWDPWERAQQGRGQCWPCGGRDRRCPRARAGQSHCGARAWPERTGPRCRHSGSGSCSASAARAHSRSPCPALLTSDYTLATNRAFY